MISINTTELIDISNYSRTPSWYDIAMGRVDYQALYQARLSPYRTIPDRQRSDGSRL